MASSSLKYVYSELVSSLRRSGIEPAEMEARIMLEERTPFRQSDIVTSPKSEIPQEQRDNLSADLVKRIEGMPLSRIYGMNEFWGLPIKVNSHVLDPRNDTETIIDLALQRFDKGDEIRILDLGTGSGCIITALLHEFPNSSGVAVDVSKDALSCSKKNAELNHVHDRCEFLLGSWFEPVEGRFDLIVSNPPYIRSSVIPDLSNEVKNHDPILALDGGVDGLDPYKVILSQIKSYLAEAGIGLLEIGYDQAEDIMRLSDISGFAQRAVHMDMSGNPRVVEISCGDK